MRRAGSESWPPRRRSSAPRWRRSWGVGRHLADRAPDQRRADAQVAEPLALTALAFLLLFFVL
jgi:hypothetical protein